MFLFHYLSTHRTKLQSLNHCVRNAIGDCRQETRRQDRGGSPRWLSRRTTVGGQCKLGAALPRGPVGASATMPLAAGLLRSCPRRGPPSLWTLPAGARRGSSRPSQADRRAAGPPPLPLADWNAGKVIGKRDREKRRVRGCGTAASLVGSPEGVGGAGRWARGG
jgi:hypothetical protein